MLVLTRREGQDVLAKFGDQMLIVRIVEVGRDRVKIGFEAPETIEIHRREVAEQLDEWREWAEAEKKEPIKRPA